MTYYVYFLGFCVAVNCFVLTCFTVWHIRLARELREHIERYAHMCGHQAKQDLRLMALEHPEWGWDAQAIIDGPSGPLWLRRQP